MTIYYSNDSRIGLKIILNDEPYAIESSEFVKPGKGQSFTRVKMRRLLTGSRVEKIFRSTDTFEIADISEINLTYLYNDGKLWYFMDSKSYEQLAIDAKVIGNQKKWLLNQVNCSITLWNGRPISINLPKFVELLVVDTDPGLKGNSANNSSKLAILATGAKVKVPLFIQIGEIIRVDTRSEEYVSRVKKPT